MFVFQQSHTNGGVSDTISQPNEVTTNKTQPDSKETIKIVKGLGNITIKETQTATFECQLSNSNACLDECKWLKSGTMLKVSTAYLPQLKNVLDLVTNTIKLL